MKCEHDMKPGMCVVPTCVFWDGLQSPWRGERKPLELSLATYKDSAKYRAHRDRLSRERVVATLEAYR